MARARCAALELLANAFARLDDEPRAAHDSPRRANVPTSGATRCARLVEAC
jgi:hypothetical protein